MDLPERQVIALSVQRKVLHLDSLTNSGQILHKNEEDKEDHRSHETSKTITVLIIKNIETKLPAAESSLHNQAAA